MRVVLGLLVVLAVPALGWQGPEGTATVRGRVVDAVTGRPLRNVFINLYPQFDVHPGMVEPPKRSAITDGAGGFEVAKLIAGEYTISASGPGDYLNIEYGAATPGGPSRRLRVKDGAQIDVTLRAWRGAVIAGHVYDERGAPVIGAQVRLFEKDAEAYGSGTTDDRGAYEIVRMAPGEYTVGVAVSLANLTVSSTPSRDGARSWPAMIPYVMDRGLRTVMLVQGAPLPPATEDGRIQVYATTFAGGAATKEAAAYMRLAAGERRENVDIALPAVRGTRVSGLATAAADVNGTILRLTPEGAASNFDLTRIDTTVGPDGRFVFAATPPGKYVLTGYRRKPPLVEVTLTGGALPWLQLDDHFDRDAEDFWAEMPISVGDGDVDNLVVMLVPGTAVSGRVVAEEADGTAGRAARVSISLAAAARPGLADTYVEVQPDGSFSIRVRPGAYRVLADVDQDGRPFKTTIAGGQEIGDGPLIVGSDPVRDVQFVFSRFDTALQGSVTEADGSPSPDATVLAIPADRNKWFRLEQSGRAKTTRTITGAYRLADFAPGDYYVVALHDFIGTPSARHAASLAPMATRVTVRNGEPVTVNLVARDRE